MSTMRAAAPPARVAVVLGGWALAVLLLAALAVTGSVAPSELPASSDLGPFEWAVGLLAVSAQAALLLRTSRSPRLGLVVVAAVVPVTALAGLGVATGVTSVAVLIATYRLMIDAVWPRPASALAVAAGLVGIGDLIRAVRADEWTAGSVVAAALQGIGTVGVAAVVGAIVAFRRETARVRVSRDVAVAGELVALSQVAVARERVAMARELHDIAAHHLSGIAVMTAALDRQIDTDPEGAKTAVRQVRHQSTAMLRDLRSLVALLREDDPAHPGLEVEPETLGGIRALVETARSAGRNVELSVIGADGATIPALRIGPLAQLAGYRTVQESLTNAARHAPGAPCEVVIDIRDPSQVVLTVHNDAPPTPPPVDPGTSTGTGAGFGIVGMQERADLTDAHLSAGPTPQGGWIVQLTIPTETQEDPS